MDRNFQAIPFAVVGETHGSVGRGFQPRASPQPVRSFAEQDDASRLPPRASRPREAGIVEVGRTGVLTAAGH